MKKVLLAILVVGLLAGAAFAADGGHGGHVNPDNFKKVDILPSDIPGLPDGVTVTSASGLTAAEFAAARVGGMLLFDAIAGVADTGATYNILAAVSLDIDGTSADKAKAKTLNMKKVYDQLSPKPNRVFIYKQTPTAGMKELNIGNDGIIYFAPNTLADFFSANYITFAQKVVGGSSGGGCSTGAVAPAFLLLLAPLAILLKK